MSRSDSQSQKRKRGRETSEVFDSVFSFLMDFADNAGTIVPQPKRRSLVGDDTTNEVHDGEQEPLESGGDGGARKLFGKLPSREKEELLKDAFGEIVGSILDNLPEDGREEFLVRCFDGLLPKLPCGSQRVIKLKMMAAPSQSQEASAIQSAPEPALPFPKSSFPKDDLVPVNMYVDNDKAGDGFWDRPGRHSPPYSKRA